MGSKNERLEAASDGVPVTYSITGIVDNVGPANSYVVLGQGSDTVTVRGPNKFTFVTPLPPGHPYQVVLSQTSPGLACTVNHGRGIMPAAPVNNVQVHCAPPAVYTWPFDAGTSAAYTFDAQLNFAGGTVAVAAGDSTPRAVFANTPVSFSHLYKLDYFAGAPGCPRTFSATFSPDTVTWYYYAGLHWNIANGTRNQSMDAREITPQLLNDYANFVGPGLFYVKTFLSSDGNTPCSLDAINVTYDQNSATPVPGVAVRFTVTNYGTPRTAGVPGTVTVTAYDAFGSVATAYVGTVLLTSTDPQAALGSAYTFSAANAGVATLPVTLFTAGTQAIGAHDSNSLGISGIQPAIVVQPAAAAHLRLTGYPSPQNTEVQGNVLVTAVDNWNNIAIGYTGTVHLTTDDPNALLSADYTFSALDAGVHTLQATFATGGYRALAAQDTANPQIYGFHTPIDVIALPATHFRVSANPNVLMAGQNSNIEIVALDNANHTVRNYTGSIQLNSSDAAASLPTPYTFASSDQGDAVLPGAHFVTAGNQTLSANDLATPSIAGAAYNIIVNPNVAVRLAASGYPASVTAGQQANIVVTAYDAFNNIAAGYTGSVHLSTTDPNAAVPGNYTYSAINAGTAAFPVIFLTSGNQTINANDVSNAALAAHQGNIIVNPNAAVRLQLSGYASPRLAGVQGNVTVTARDIYNNIATTYVGSIHLSSSDGLATLAANTNFTLANAGVIALPATLNTSGNQTLSANDVAHPSIAGSLAVVVNPSYFPLGGSVTGLVTGNVTLTNTANADTIAVGNGNFVFDQNLAYNSNFTVSLTNPAGQTCVFIGNSNVGVMPATNDYNVLVSCSANTYSLGGRISGLLANTNVILSDGNDTISRTNSAYTFPTLLPYTRAYSIGITNPSGQTCVFNPNTAGNGNMPNTPVTNANVVCTVNAATRLVLSAYTSPRVAGQNSNINITAYDANNNVAVGYTGTVHMTTSDPNAIFNPNFTFVLAYAGSANVPIAMLTAGTQSVTGNDTTTPSVAGTQTAIVVNPNAAIGYTLTNYTTPRTAGQQGNVTITAYDPYGNIATTYVGKAHVTSTDGNATKPPDYNFTLSNNGVASLPVTLNTAGTWSISANDTVTPSIAGMQNLIVVNPNTAARLGVTGYTTPRVAGQQGNVTITAYDAQNNVAVAYVGTVHVNSTDSSAVKPADYTFGGANAGVASLPVTLVTAGTWSVSANDTTTPTIAGMQNMIVVNANVATHFAVVAPATMAAGQPNQFTVKVLDNYNNTVPNYNNTISFTTTDPCATGPATYTFSAADQGNKVIPTNLTFFTAGVQSLSVSDANGLGPNAANVTVVAGTPNQIIMVLSSTATAGTALSPNLTIVDAYGNVATTFTGSVMFTSTDTSTSAVKPSTTAFTLGNAGKKIFTNGLKFATAGNQTFTVTDAADNLIAASQNVIVSPGTMTNMNMAIASTATAGQPLPVRLGVYDAYGNVVTNYTGSVTLSSNDYQGSFTPLTYTFSAADQGNALISTAVLETAGLRTVTAVASTSGNPNAKSAVVVSPNILIRLRFGPLQIATANTNFNNTISATDIYGNLVSSYTGAVSISSTDPNGTPATGTPMNVTITSGGTASVNGLKFQTVGNQMLTATDPNGLTSQQAFSVRKLMVLTNAQSGNLLTGGPVGNNSGNPYYASNGRFYHADSYYNAFYTWNTLPTSNVNANSYFTASSTLGPTSYNQPHSIISDGNTGIFLTDTGSNRILHYHQIPTALVAPDSVVGQPNLTTGASGCSAVGLNYPYDVALATNANALLVAESGNGRVVVYSPIPFTSGQAATMAIGQPSLTSCSGATTASRLGTSTYSVGLWTDGVRLAVSDILSNRVLFFNSLPTLLQNGVSGPAADLVIGQPTFLTHGNPGSNPNAYTLYYPTYINSDGTQLMISDGGSNRVLIYGSYPTASTPAATYVLGQATMTTGTSGSTTTSLNNPSGLLLANNFLFVGDAGNGRFVIYLSQ